MTTYRYKGQTKDGTAVSGVIRAYDEFEAASRLRETVAVITRLEEVREKKESIFNRPIGLKIKEKELALICSQFAIILSAGMSIQHCVEMVAAQTRNRHIRQMLEKVAEEVGAGYSMAQSFENNAPYLPKTFIETVRAGEQSGTLEECFQRLHRYYDKSAKTKAKVVSTLTYPAMVIVVAIVVFIIIIAVAVPAFNDVFAEMDTQLPGITRVLLAISDFFVGWWWLLLLIAAGLGIAYMVARRSVQGRKAIAAWSLTKAPLHRLHSLSAAAQFAHSMATLLAALWTAKMPNKWLAPLPPVICNAVLIGAMIAWYLTGFSAQFPALFAYNAVTVGIGEAVACYVLGLLLLTILPRIPALRGRLTLRA